MSKVIQAAFAAFLMFDIAGCSSQVNLAGAPGNGDANNSGTERSFVQFADLPEPGKSSINLDRTLVFGGGDAWFGRLTIESYHNANDMFNFYKQQLPGFGWQEITSVRSKVSVLTYSRGDRILTIQIASSTIVGSEITITVSIRGSGKTIGGPSVPNAVRGNTSGGIQENTPPGYPPGYTPLPATTLPAPAR